MNGPLLVVHPGADYATGDVYQGLIPSLKRLGVPVVEYPLNHALPVAKGYLDFCLRRHKRMGGPLKDVVPTPADVLYRACSDAMERALYWDCRWVLLMSGMYFSLRALRLLRRAGRKVAVLFTESPYDTSSEFAFAAEADLCWTNERTSVSALKLACPRTFYLPHAHDPERHRPGAVLEDEAEIPAHDVVFVGSGFRERIELLSAIDWTGIDFGLYGEWGMLGSRHPLRKHLRGGVVDNATAAALYRRSKIGVNLFRTTIGHAGDAPRIPARSAESANPRLLELAACGTFVVSEWRREVGEVFGGAVPTFRDAHGLATLLKEWLPRDADRAKRAASLPHRVADRTFDGMALRVVRDLVKADADAEPWRPLEERLGVA